jgi:cytoskeletal protein CcmA (bactofilin family)
MDSEKPTLIDAHVEFEGVLKGKDVHIQGRFRGEIQLSGRLSLGESARVEAKVMADSAEIAGDFKGQLKVRRLVLLDKGRFDGTLDAQSMVVHEGATLNGAVNSGGAAAAKPASEDAAKADAQRAARPEAKPAGVAG